MSYKINFSRNLARIDSSDVFDSNPITVPFYEVDYVCKNPSLHEEDAEAKFQVIKGILKYLIEIAKPKTIADVGCGSCLVITKLLDYLHTEVDPEISGVGIDVSARILLHSEKHPSLVKLRADGSDIPLERKSISLTFCIDILEHVGDPKLLLAEVARISHFVILKVPLELSLYTTLKGGGSRLDKLSRQYGHMHHFDRQSLLRLITPYFEIIHEGYDVIPNRIPMLDLFQRLLISFKLKRLFRLVFGGFIILLVKSR